MIQTSDRMQYFTILKYKLLTHSIFRKIEARVGFSETAVRSSSRFH